MNPSGYAKAADFYFMAVPSSEASSYTGFPTGSDVAIMLTNQYGTVNLGWATMSTKTVEIDEKDETVTVGTFTVDNYAKSIFPRVGGTGIQAYIGAGLIVMLIAGGAAWYIKRRQNQ